MLVPRFTPGKIPLLVGGHCKKIGLPQQRENKKWDIVFDKHGKISDVIIHDTRNNWLVVVLKAVLVMDQ